MLARTSLSLEVPFSGRIGLSEPPGFRNPKSGRGKLALVVEHHSCLSVRSTSEPESVIGVIRKAVEEGMTKRAAEMDE